MIQKSTLKTNHIAGCSLYNFLQSWLTYVATVLLLCCLPTQGFSKSSGDLDFPSRTINHFNKIILEDVIALTAMDRMAMVAPCPGGSGVIGGVAFQDFNYNGLDDQIGGGIAGIEVHIFGCDADGNSESISNTTTDTDGTYFFSGLNDGETYRIEFIIPNSLSHLQSGFNGADSRTTVQFVNSPSCEVSIGLASPSDFCEADPSIAVPCYVNGDPLAAGSGSADEEALVYFKSSYEGGNPRPIVLATAAEIGATWGVTYHNSTKTIYASAFLKRHVGFGPLGIGGIYQIDISGETPQVTPFIDVNSIGINVGSYPSNSERGLTADINLPNNDTQAFDEVGKKGIGGMCMAEDGSKMYLVNITEKTLHSINITGATPTSSDVQSFTIPNPNCSGGEFRPFAVEVQGGDVYVAGVCDAEASGNKSDLRAIVYRLNGNSFIEVLNASLDYTKGLASRSCDDGGWFPWRNTLPEACFESGGSQVIVYPTPHLTALEFDDDGNLILGFTDRMGNQLGFQNFGPTGGGTTFSAFTGGEILKAGRNQDGTFTLENNATVNGVTTGGADNGEGPGGGEFYLWDAYDIGANIPRPHSETAQGGLTSIRGSGQVISTALDPFGTSVNSGGVNYFDNETGAVRDPGYRVFRSGSSSPASFSKANGLGDIIALCGEAPIEIGGRLWIDANENGVQDPCEAPFSGVEIALYAMDGQVNQVVTTDEHGEYYFAGDESDAPEITPNTDYYIVIGFGEQFDNFNGVLLDSFFLSAANVGMGANPDLNDSDGMITPNGILDNAFEGWPSIQVTTGNIGEVTHDNDAGFFIEVVQPKANISGFVWNDLNENGLQNDGELGIPGVSVSLYTSDNILIATISTDASGNYLFEGVMGNDYYIIVDASNDPEAGDNFEVTLQDIGSDENLDSDFSPEDGRVDFTFEPLNGDVEFDAGFTLPVSQVVGSVFNDQDGDGLQGSNEGGIGGVTVTLNNPDGTVVATTTTDENGNYTFDNIMEGEYFIEVDVSTNSDGIPNFEGTAQDAGDDDFDSDVNPSTGQSEVFSHNPAEGNTDIDAGFIEPTATITGFVWLDLNENGLQNDGENGIPGVRVDLIDANGNIVATTETDANGNYIFNDVKSDSYTLDFDATNDPVVGDNFETTLQDVGSDERFDSDIDQTSNDVSFDFDASMGNADFDAGYKLPLGNIMGIAFEDVDKDGLQGGNEPMIGGVTVTLFSSDGTEIGTTTTTSNGNYAFNEIMKGDYYISFDINTNTAGIDNYVGTIQDAGDDDFDSDIDPNSGRTNTFSFNPSDGDGIYDGGYFIGTGTITGTAFNDLNENGLQDANEPGIPGVPVTVLAPDGIPINSGITDANGDFSIDGIPSGTVTVLFDPANNASALEDLMVTEQDVNNNQNDDFDSDINPNKESNPITFEATVGADVDAGFFKPVDPVMIGDFVFKDCNENGIQDPDEVGVPNVPITLRGNDNLGAAVEMQMTTNSMGKYLFTIPRPGTYTLDFDIPDGVTGLSFAPKNRGGQDGDSNVNPLSGETDPITLASGESNLTIDAGIIDKSPPLIFNVPPDVTVDCNDIPNPPNSIKGVDNCDPSVPVTYSERVINAGSCPYIIERKWEAVDDCGNTAERTQRITVTDTKAPVITIANPLLLGLENGGEIIFDCDNLPEFSAADVNATDDCSEVEVKFVDLIREQGNCAEDGFIVKMTCGWIAEDDCGNRSEYNIVILVVDTKSPTLLNVPEDITINADEGQFIPPFANTVTATDNCDEYVRIEQSEERITGVCGTEIIRSWIGFDDCGNKDTASQKITVLQDCSCPDELVSSTLVWDAACDGSEGGKIILDLTADLNKYDITITPNTGNANLVGNMFTDLAPGNYTVMVNYESTEDCSETYNFTVNTATPSTIEVVNQTRADCNEANGTVTLSPSTNTYAWSDGGTGAQRDDLAAGEYIVTFTDENNCQGAQVIIITNPDGCECIDFSANLLLEIMPTCNGTTNGRVDIEVTGGTAPYTYQWHNGQTTKDLFGVTGGPYSVTVTDASGCSTTLEGNLGQPDAIQVTETLMNGACGEKGAIDIFVSGGTAPYTYNWNTGATTEDLTNLVTGSYTITVTDANNCEANLTVTVSNSGDINIDLTSINPTCASDNNGRVTATVTGGQNPLTYEWSNGATTSTIENVVAGTYAVMVTDRTGCSAMAEVTLGAPDLIVVTAIPNQPECGDALGNIMLTVNGGVAPFTYNWDSGQTTADINNLTAGTYNVTVTDASGCSGTSSATVEVFTTITATANTQAPACGGENGGITLEVSGGRPAYTYLWSNGAVTRDITNVSPGAYSVEITDANGCTTTINAEIAAAAGLTISSTPTSPSCAGEAGGSISVDISGGAAPYTYTWSNGATTEDISNLMPGGYTLNVTDANGCTISTTAVIDAPSALAATSVPTMPKCIGMVGSIDITVTGGSGNYTYAWDFGATSEDIEGLLSGDYTVTITDENGCSITNTTTIVVPTAIEGITNVSSPSCSGQGGQIDLTVTGGTPPYTFGWSNGAGSEDLTNVAPGDYNVVITDANGCTAIVNAMVESTAGIGVTENITNATCAGASGGSIDLDVVGGTAPYTYAWTNGATTKNIADLMPGAYSVVITDANGCELMGTYTVEAPTAILVEAEIESPDCSDSFGKINITVSGGASPYTFSWSNGATTRDLTSVPAGNYQVTVTDAFGCSQLSENIVVSDPEDFVVSLNPTDILCYGETNGRVDLTVSGFGPYTYAWSNGQFTQNIANLSAGTYAVTVTNAKGCQKIAEAVVNIPDAISLGMTFSNPRCPTDLGSINVDVQGGTLPYSFLWNNGATTEDLTDVPAGRYEVVVMDANGCTLNGSANIRAASEIIAVANVANQTCAAAGNIDLDVSGGTAPYTYKWNTGASAQDLSDLTPGNYEVTITDSKGCYVTQQATIVDDCVCPSPLVNQNMVTNSRCGEANGSITIIVNGEVSDFQFEWTPDLGTPGAFNNERTNLPAGSYDVLVTFGARPECAEVQRLVVGNKDGLTGSVTSNVPATCGAHNGQVILTPGLTYFWWDGSQSQNRSNLAPGTYTLETLDPSGCEGSLMVTVTQEPCNITCDLTAMIEGVKNPDCDGNLGSINLTVSGGTAPYRYNWNDARVENVEDPSGLTDGSYLVRITDSNGCEASASITLEKPDCNVPVDPPTDNPNTPLTCEDLIVSLEVEHLSCDGANDGTIKANVINGTAPFIYRWSTGETTQSISNLAPKGYWLEVVDAKGCRKNSLIRVMSMGGLVVSETRTVLDCERQEIKLNVTGGRAPYKWECEGVTGTLLDPLNLAPGNYSCLVTDGAGCTVTHLLEVEDYQPLAVTGVVKNTTCGQEDGSVDLTPTGGTAPYTFEWDCGLYGDEDQFNLGPHTYNVTVTDATNCITTATYTIADCSGEGFGFIAVNAVSLGDLSVQVEWETANEQMVGNYVLLHSTDGENFDVLGGVMEGKGPIVSAKYEITESVTYGNNFFKLKYIDSNGEEVYSEVAEVLVFLDESTGRVSIPAVIYPNPTHDEFSLDFARPIDAVIQVMVTDMDGVILENIELLPGTPKHVFDIRAYESGIYNITLQQRRKKLKTYRLIKANE